jgi:hypothetical protein
MLWDCPIFEKELERPAYLCNNATGNACPYLRHYMLAELMRFSIEHEVAPDQLLRYLAAATVQLPALDHREEAGSLAEEHVRLPQKCPSRSGFSLTRVSRAEEQKPGRE